VLQRPAAELRHPAFTPGAEKLVAVAHFWGLGRRPDEVWWWRRTDGRGTRLPAAPGPINCLATAPGGSILALGRGGGRVGLWDLESGRPLGRLRRGEQAIAALAFGPGATLAAADAGGAISLWDIRHRRLTGAFGGHQAIPECLALSPDGELLAVVTNPPNTM